MKKTIIILSLLFFSLNCSAQVKVGDNVIIPIDKYRTLRDSTLSLISECDAIKIDSKNIKQECDSINSLQDYRIIFKDSIIVGLKNKCDIKDSIISEKNNTIKSITEIVRPGKFRVKSEFWIGCLSGLVVMALILK